MEFHDDDLQHNEEDDRFKVHIAGDPLLVFW